MSNDEYLQWQGLLYKVAKRYVGINNLYDIDDLIQIGAIGLAKGLETYENESGIPIINYLANNVSWTIYREINKKKSIQNTISIYTPIGDEEEGTILEDILQDENVNIQAEIEAKIMVNYYESECRRVLSEDKFEVCYLRWFENMPYRAIEKVTEKNNISGILLQSQSLLLAKSRLFNEEYKKLVGISEYNTERIALI